MSINTILIFGISVCLLVLVFFSVVYYFWKANIRSEHDYQISMKFPQGVEEQRDGQARVNTNWRVLMETPAGAVAAEIRNISLGGAFICCRNPLRVGEVFRMTIIGPDRELARATAEVVWSNANAPLGKVINRRMGVRFIKMSDRYIQLVRRISQKNH